MGLIPGTEDGITAICIYIIFYVTMNLGVFLFILNMNRVRLMLVVSKIYLVYIKANL